MGSVDTLMKAMERPTMKGEEKKMARKKETRLFKT